MLMDLLAINQDRRTMPALSLPTRLSHWICDSFGVPHVTLNTSLSEYLIKDDIREVRSKKMCGFHSGMSF